jgi:hypothetical protein
LDIEWISEERAMKKRKADNISNNNPTKNNPTKNNTYNNNNSHSSNQLNMTITG